MGSKTIKNRDRGTRKVVIQIGVDMIGQPIYHTLYFQN